MVVACGIMYVVYHVWPVEHQSDRVVYAPLAVVSGHELEMNETLYIRSQNIGYMSLWRTVQWNTCIGLP